MKIRERVGAVIIQENKVLLLTRGGFSHIWTPGGKKEKGEDDKQCLARELKEEINAELKEMKFYKEIVAPAMYYPDTLMKSRIYLASIDGDIKELTDHKSYWLSKKDIESDKYNIMPALRQEVISKIIKEGLLK